eukprot:TRINITY_DN95585_c0_g1_i1.p1 TRINITY_DN95585_c0_g1~~TRINITY_DN95585_c0_g1_i1.p1  ORF type:complete len:139 (+),score=10.03 TRINITY_DN95585_c0_g1_i1:232-648(+)
MCGKLQKMYHALPTYIIMILFSWVLKSVPKLQSVACMELYTACTGLKLAPEVQTDTAVQNSTPTCNRERPDQTDGQVGAHVIQWLTRYGGLHPTVHKDSSSYATNAFTQRLLNMSKTPAVGYVGSCPRPAPTHRHHVP